MKSILKIGSRINPQRYKSFSLDKWGITSDVQSANLGYYDKFTCGCCDKKFNGRCGLTENEFLL